MNLPTPEDLKKKRTELHLTQSELAKRAGVPVVPLALKTNGWGNGHLIKDFGKIDPSKSIHFCFGDPFEISGSGREEHETVFQFIQKKLDSWHDQ